MYIRKAIREAPKTPEITQTSPSRLEEDHEKYSAEDSWPSEAPEKRPEEGRFVSDKGQLEVIDDEGKARDPRRQDWT